MLYMMILTFSLGFNNGTVNITTGFTSLESCNSAAVVADSEFKSKLGVNAHWGDRLSIVCKPYKK